MNLLEDSGFLDAREDEKRCARCSRMLPASWFNLSRMARDGLQSYCRECQAEYKRIHPTREYKYKQGIKGRLLPIPGLLGCWNDDTGADR